MSQRYLPFQLKEEIVIRKLYSFHYTELVKDYVYPGEKHDFWEFLYVDRGEVQVFSGKQSYVLRQGEIVFYAPNSFHSLRCNRLTPANVFIISFECTSEAMQYFANRSLHLGDRERELLSQIISEGHQLFPKRKWSSRSNHKLVQVNETKQDIFGAAQLLKIYMEALLIQLIRNHTHVRKTPKLSAVTKEREEQGLAAEIVKYLNERVTERLTLEKISADFALSETYLRNVFRNYAGCGIMEYLTQLKIEQAKMLIREETWTITEIAEQLGYSSIHHFSRQFKQKTGMSPSEYLRSLKARMKT